MDQYLKDNSKAIFREAVAPMKCKLEQLCGYLQISLDIRAPKMIDRVAEDYRNALTRPDAMENSNEIQVVRNEVSLLLGGIDAHFEHTLRVHAVNPPLEPSLAVYPTIKSEPDQELP